jgi:hypothetical protein
MGLLCRCDNVPAIARERIMDWIFFWLFFAFFGSDSDLPRLGIPGGRGTAVRWVAGGLAAGGVCGLLMYAVTLYRPELAEMFWDMAFIPISLAVVTAQRLTIAKQLSSTSAFYRLSCVWGVLASVLQLTGWWAAGVERFSDISPDRMSYVAIGASIVFGLFLGLPQSGELANGGRDRAVWSVMTGLGAAAGTLGGILLVNRVFPGLDLLGRYPAGMLWIVPNIFQMAIWTGIACAQALLIFVSNPVCEAPAPDGEVENEKSPGR